MDNVQKRIVFIGAGAIGTALGNIIAEKENCDITLHSVESDVVDIINHSHLNPKYFPSIRLNPLLKATGKNVVLESADVIFLAIPSLVVIDYLQRIQGYLNPKAILVNLAKGFGEGHMTIAESLVTYFPNPVATLKGPSFAKDIINRIPTGMTLGYTDEEVKEVIAGIYTNTPVFLDFSHDMKGVELLSILKNIYAIVLGIVDAQFDSPNIRFLFLTKAFKEMQRILLVFGGKEETLFNYCGYGDFTMTSLNDLSRNRTLGLLIGKGFFTEHVSHDLVLEGKIAANVFFEEISRVRDVKLEFPIISELYKILNHKYDISGFVNTVLKF
ncbi:MAG: NAD(P)H-dependent glycerol-3-phosphate dehydrogenase [Bacteroidota bacterium]